MINLYTVLFVLTLTFPNAQEKNSGKYENGNDKTLALNSDYTFDYSASELKANEFIGRIINDIKMPPHCGYIASATLIEFEILESKIRNYNKKSIPIIIRCPEFFGMNFFNKIDSYKIKISDSSGTDFRWSIVNLHEFNKYDLDRKYWLVNIKKL